MNNKIKVAFIGAGNMSYEHIRSFADIGNVELSGIYSRTFHKAEKLALDFSIKYVAHSIKDLYEETKADAVIVSVPELSTKLVCYEAFKFPWYSLIEKPAGINIYEANEILSYSRINNHRSFVALNRRQYSSNSLVLSDLKAHTGKRLVHVYDQENPSEVRESGQPQEVVDNWMYANSIHMVDYFRQYCRGDLLGIDKISDWEPNKSCFVLSRLKYSSGDIGFYEAIWEGPGPWGVTVNTQSRRWEMRPLEKATFQDFRSRKLNNIDTDVWDQRFKPGLRRQADELIKAVRGKIHNLVSIESSVESMEIVRIIYGK